MAREEATNPRRLAAGADVDGRLLRGERGDDFFFAMNQRLSEVVFDPWGARPGVDVSVEARRGGAGGEGGIADTRKERQEVGGAGGREPGSVRVIGANTDTHKFSA